MRSGYRITVLVAWAVFAMTHLGSAQEFVTQCHPFKSIETITAADKACPAQGDSDASKDPGIYQQDLVKNDFCAATPMKDMTIVQLGKLQTTTAGTLGVKQGTPPKERSILQSAQLGSFHEHDLVRLTAYVFEAHTADYTTTGESVNCNVGVRNGHTDAEAMAENDIHIALVEKGVEDECRSVTAEVSPHMRPASWNNTSVSDLKGKLIRVSGQLMYDDSHHVCTNGKHSGDDPARQSLWEIHPVYSIEVCQNDSGGGSCAAGGWKPL